MNQGHSSRRSDCRLCGSKNLELVLPLVPTPLADAYVSDDRRGEDQPVFNLDVFMCLDCAHVQLLEVVDPEVVFGKNFYTSRSSPDMEMHFRRYSPDVIGEFGLGNGDLAVDIGSNDGTLLGFLGDGGMRILGIEPAAGIAELARERGIPTVVSWIDVETAERVRTEHGPASLVTANNVFAHSDDMGEFAEAVRVLLGDQGIFIFEVNHLGDMVDNMAFDTIYHEHLAYHTVSPLRSFLAAHGLELFDVRPIATKGGSMRGFAQRVGGLRPVAAGVEQYVERERKEGMLHPGYMESFRRRIEQRRDQVRMMLEEVGARTKIAVGFGASASSTTLLYHYGLNDYLSGLIDDWPERQGLFSPGLHLPVMSGDVLNSADAPESVVILAWRFWEAILRNYSTYLGNGGRMLIPLPEPRWITDIDLATPARA